MTSPLLKGFILVLIFAAVALLAEGLVGWFSARRGTGSIINERLKLIARGMDRSERMVALRRAGSTVSTGIAALDMLLMAMERTLQGAGVRHSPHRVLGLMFGAVALIAATGLILIVRSGRPIGVGVTTVILLFALVIGLVLPLLVLGRMRDRRYRKMEAQFPAALDVFVRGLRAGHPVTAALGLLAAEMPDPIGTEFGLVVDEITYGADMRDSLQAMADRWGLADMQMFVVCLSVQSETGGNLSEILDNLAHVIRERASMYLKVRALSSEGRMTALILTALPVLAFAGLFAFRPAFYLDVAGEKSFMIGFAGLITLYAIGFITIRRMIDLKV